MSKSPDAQKRKPLVSYPISPKSKVKSLSQRSVVDLPTISSEDFNNQLDAEKVSRKVEKFIDESSVSKCSPKRLKTVKDPKRHQVVRRTVKKQVFTEDFVIKQILKIFRYQSQKIIVKSMTRKLPRIVLHT